VHVNAPGSSRCGIAVPHTTGFRGQHTELHVGSGDSIAKLESGSVIRERRSHIRLERNLPGRPIRITVPAHLPLKRSTLSHILKQAEVSLDQFLAEL
jgi:predicted RNase H-like HicB family nuclease/predicted RNA binding protein YcfA (HicA-like mRNA interferase family)